MAKLSLPAVLRRSLLAAGAVGDAPSARQASLMLARLQREPFSRAGWLFEVKYDGFRMLVAKENGVARLSYRSGGDATRDFPEIADAVRALTPRDLLMDGELVALAPDGRPSFQLLQSRYRQGRGRAAAAGPTAAPCRYFAFDVLRIDGLDLRRVPLRNRKEVLAGLVPAGSVLASVDYVEQRGAQLFDEIRRLGLEGMVAKRADSPYGGGRTGDWLKIPIETRGTFVVVGHTRPGLGQEGGLHLARAHPDRLVYAGRVGSGFEAGVLGAIRAELARFRVEVPPCVGAVPGGRGHTWVEPRVRCEVRYKEMTDDALLRHPVFVRFMPATR